MELYCAIEDFGADPRPRAGDVIAIQPDGWAWSVLERSNPRARIIRAPILPTLATVLQEHGGDRHRKWTIDLSRLSGRLEQGVANERTRDEVTRAVVQK